MELKISSLQETNDLGYKLGKLLQTKDVITLSGDLGAGKTTLTKAIGKALNIKKAISSPTFTILKIYHGDKTLNHIDAYRLENGSQDLGFEELFDDGITIIEWPQFMSEYLPEERLEISIKRLDEEERLFEFVACGDRYEHILKELVK
ncbi:MAG: tRNA (adenosine(37)-N6)-threonylcarbamoyltransferase complex ATPase subunit type 1 TsaE [Erysipelotrichaceae bacterium]|nr:tRNA (adenosine(37)-N6)-threonylcarbamoyltransferase complex ATPase subunit type 1 TsaE [Erysipelotrichaceae bacterium]